MRRGLLAVIFGAVACLRPDPDFIEPTSGTGDGTQGDETQGGMETFATATAETGVGDASAGSGMGPVCTGERPSCTVQYGWVTGFELCEEAADYCRFHAQIDGQGCVSVCTAMGGVCLSAAGNGRLACEVTSPSTCDNLQNGSDICVCSREC